MLFTLVLKNTIVFKKLLPKIGTFLLKCLKMVDSLSGKPLYVMHLEFHNKEINKKQKIDQVATNHANEN